MNHPSFTSCFASELSKLTDYIKQKGYKTLDITKTMTIKTYGMYIESLVKMPKVVAYFEITDKTREIANFSGVHSTCNIYLLNKDNYVTFPLLKFEKEIEIKINKFLEDGIMCNVCMDDTAVGVSCMRCSFNMCYKCAQQINLMTCPQCRGSIRC